MTGSVHSKTNKAPETAESHSEALLSKAFQAKYAACSLFVTLYTLYDILYSLFCIHWKWKLPG
ncbi:hypothetical protein GCM10010917_31860 [Paenibacillus physcomitrellae]|uniref:Uncharacterized protein n=1 Tax=Paenibacillus physcomitrellae TaxID=1619311 RepID=A0ABQ1GIP6_9BACL|nr:hypothetical protein GCM10010917_31860 [Paenibacillus physcomitrellae]